MEGQETCPLPEDPVLAEVAAGLNSAGHWGWMVDPQWRIVFMTDDLRVTFGGQLEHAPVALGEHFFGAESVKTSLEYRAGPNQLGLFRDMFMQLGPWVLADTPGGREELRKLVDAALRDLVDGVSAKGPSVMAHVMTRGTHLKGQLVDVPSVVIRIRDDTGRLAGTVIINKPAPGMTVLAAMAAGGDLAHFQRMQQVAKPARRPTAILFADLEASSPLARRLSTARYFELGRRLTRVADQCVVDAGGLVGRHAGDGILAFFLAESTGSESAAARACIEAARRLRRAATDVAARSELPPEDLVLRFGLHWGATLYVGQILTSGRAEVTALGDEVNEGARIEACATSGRALASKALLERLNAKDAAALELDLDHITYTPLADLPTATEKARRDAPAIAVCEV
jgi:class 3 adenylate cyclase